MTLLIAIEKDDKIHYAGDRCETSGYTKRVLPHSKWIPHRGWRIGLAGSAKFGSLLLTDGRWRSILGPPGEESIDQVFSFVRCCQEIIAADGWHPEKSDRYPNQFNTAGMIVSPIGLFSFCSSFSVYQHGPGEFVAMGSGADFAIGCWEACSQIGGKRTTDQIIGMCMEAGAKYAGGVSPPFDCAQLELRPGPRSMIWDGGAHK